MLWQKNGSNFLWRESVNHTFLAQKVMVYMYTPWFIILQVFTIMLWSLFHKLCAITSAVQSRWLHAHRVYPPLLLLTIAFGGKDAWLCIFWPRGIVGSSHIDNKPSIGTLAGVGYWVRAQPCLGPLWPTSARGFFKLLCWSFQFCTFFVILSWASYM